MSVPVDIIRRYQAGELISIANIKEWMMKKAIACSSMKISVQYLTAFLIRSYISLDIQGITLHEQKIKSRSILERVTCNVGYFNLVQTIKNSYNEDL